MREIRLHGSEGGGTELNRSFLPLSKPDRCSSRLQTAENRPCGQNRLRYSLGAGDRIASVCALVQSDHVSASARSLHTGNGAGGRSPGSGVRESAGMAGCSTWHAAASGRKRRELSKDGDVFTHEMENRGRIAVSRARGMRPVAFGLARRGFARSAAASGSGHGPVAERHDQPGVRRFHDPASDFS